MKCDKVKKMLYDYIDGELDQKDRREVEGHLGACAKCRKFEENLRKLAVEPFEKAEKAVPPERIWSSIKEAIAQEAERKSFLETTKEGFVAVFTRPRLAFATAGVATLVACLLILVNIYLKREDPVNSFLAEQAEFLVALGENGENGTGIGDMDFGTDIEKYLL
ncbi:MAG: zf-HC2 domain-containing protein [Candidatus Omnitrophota bacterium]